MSRHRRQKWTIESSRAQYDTRARLTEALALATKWARDGAVVTVHCASHGFEIKAVEVRR